MKTLATNYLGLSLRNPIIIGSSGLTNTAERNFALEQAGAGAVVLKSLFEEQILMQTEQFSKGNSSNIPAGDYIRNYMYSHTLNEYLNLIKETKKRCSIPVIASINCYSSGEWQSFAQQIEQAGADALELNIFMLNTDKYIDSNKSEQVYIDIVRNIAKTVNIPLVVKLGQQFTNLVRMVDALVAAGAKSVVLFNKFYQPDIDLKTLEIKSAPTFTATSDFPNTLRWTSLISALLKGSNVVASKGIHDWENIVKAILAGAQAVQICSAVYKHGNGFIASLLEQVELWMKEQGYYSLDEFRGKLNYNNSQTPTIYERHQFMKYYSDDK